MRISISRWLLIAIAGIAIFVAAVWATTPSVVPMLGATVWAECFEPITIPPSDDETDLALVRRDHLDSSEGTDRDDPTLLAVTAEPMLITLNPQERRGLAGDRPAELPADQEVIREAALGTAETWLDEGRLELRQIDGSRFLIEAPARFALDPTETYTARLTRRTGVERTDNEGTVRLPKGSEVAIELPEGKPAFVQQTERLWVRPLLLPPTAGTFVPDILPAREATPYLVARLAAPGVSFDPAELRACLWLGEGKPKPVPIARVDVPTPGLAEIVVDLPTDPFPWLDWRRGRRASLAVIAMDGNYAGTGEVVYPSRFWAFMLATALALLLFLGLVWLRKADSEWKTWLMGLFLGEDRQPSLSLFQILLWTIVTVWALLFVFFNTGNLLTMTQEVMALLGFAGAGSLAARWIAASRQPAGTSNPPADKAEAQGPPRFWALLENNGHLDLFKLQLFLFTVLIAGYVMFRVVRQSAFPALDAEFLLLMGVSNGLYVGSKLAQPSPFAFAEARKLEWDLLRLRVEDLEKEAAKLEAEAQDLNTKMSQETDPGRKQALNDQKSILDKRITDVRAELAKARTDVGKKEEEYRSALAALAKA